MYILSTIQSNLPIVWLECYFERNTPLKYLHSRHYPLSHDLEFLSLIALNSVEQHLDFLLRQNIQRDPEML